MFKKIWYLILVFLLAFSLWYLSLKTTNKYDEKLLQNTIKQIISKNSNNIVTVISSKNIDLYKSDPVAFFDWFVWSFKKQISWWSWFFVWKWLILTNNHVINEWNEYIVILSDNSQYKAKLIKRDEKLDLALLKIDFQNPYFVKISDIQSTTWDMILAMWNPWLNNSNSASFWIISWENRSFKYLDDDNNTKTLSWLLQTDVSIYPWNSWWPLFNLDWEVVWITTAISWNYFWVGYVVSLDKKVVGEFMKN